MNWNEKIILKFSFSGKSLLNFSNLFALILIAKDMIALQERVRSLSVWIMMVCICGRAFKTEEMPLNIIAPIERDHLKFKTPFEKAWKLFFLQLNTNS